MSKPVKPRLGRGLSSLLGNPVALAPVPIDTPTPENTQSRVSIPGNQQATDAASKGVSKSALSATPMPVKPNQIQAARPVARPAAEQDLEIAVETSIEGGLLWLPIDHLEPNPFQPRRTFDESSLQQLADSIKKDGIMQPILIRPCKMAGAKGGSDASEPGKGSDRYQIIAGERRWRAAKLAGLTQVPTLPHELEDEQLAEWAVIENLHREDLDPIDRAQAFYKLIDHFKLTHEQVAERVGVDRVTITNTLRLLELHQDVQELIRLGKLTAGHGRAILSLGDRQAQIDLARRAMAGGWSVRMVESIVRRTSADSSSSVSSKAKTAHLTDLSRQIASQLQTKVHVRAGRKKGSGSMTIEFFSLEQFDQLLAKLGVRIE